MAEYTATGGLNTATIDALGRQPENFDYTQLSQFRVLLSNFPIAEYFCTAANIPGITLERIDRPTPLTVVPQVGTTITFEDFTMTFLVDESLKNYREMYEWMINIGFPKSHSQYRAKSRVDGSIQAGERELYSDISMFILTNKNNPTVRLDMRDAFPTTLSGLDYSTSETDTVYITATVTFAYAYYEFADV